MADLSQLTVGEYLYQLDKRFHLQLSDAQIQAACKSFEDQWFNNASELQSLDAEAFKMLPDIPPSLSSAIMRSFARGATAPEPVVPVYVAPLPPSSPVAPPRRSPSNSNSEVEIKMAHDEEKGGGRPRANSRANMEDVIEKVMAQAQASGNDFVVQGLSNLLKKSIEDSSSTARSNVLRGYLKTLNKSTLRQNATLTREFEMEHARAMAEAEEKAAMEAEEEDRPPSPATELVQSMNNLEIDPNAPGCGICHGQKDKSKTLECGHSFCVCCVHDYVMELVGRKDAVGMKCPKCPAEMTVANIQALLTPDEFNQYLEATLMAFIEQDNLTFKCPNTTCGAIIAVQPMKPMEPPNPMTEKDDDGNLLTSDAWLHFQEFRVRCRVCSTVFCAQCKNIPYHKGHTCATYREFQKARHCRFCNTKLDDANSAKDAPGPGLRDVCTQDECLQKRAVCCGRIKACGCPCNGVRDEAEKDCLPCLKHELEMADEFCAICYVEALKDAPCVQLGGQCNHVFHYQCVVSKLKAGSPGARVSFEFKCCPLCQKPIQHPSLKAVLEPINQMEENVRKKALERLQYEGRERDPAIINANGRFYNDPVAFAMHQYLFYMCHTCKKPYFAGGYQCQEANAPFNPEELVCPSCQPHSVNDCPTHGTDWLAYKCRYCCNFSTWYCWGRSHFCDQCHKSGVWQKLCEFRTGKNKKKIWEYAQCPGLQKAIAPIVADKSLSDADKEAKLEALRSDPLTCPLRLQHPPNGFEYGLGCSMCEEKKYEKLNEEAAKKAKEEAEQKRQALTAVKSALKQHPKGMLFQYQSDLDENGVFHYLGTCGKTQRWSNPADAGFVNITSSGIMQDSAPLSAALGREVVRCVTKPVRNAWMCVDLIDMSLELQRYTLRHYSSWDTECLRNWVIEGSNDGVTWDTLRQHVNDPGLNKKGGTFTWAVDSGGRKYRLFRLLQTGPNSNNHFYLAVSGMEFYGVLSDTVGGADQDEQKFAEEQKVEVIKSFEYAYDFDMNGILYYLGTNCGASKQWTNPAVLGTVIASSSGLADKPPSMPASAICGRELVRCVTQAKPNQWFQIDLKDKKANVTRYTLKHYNSWDTEALRNWRFEASNDGVSWVVLKEHVNDQVLMGKGATATWKIDEAEQKGYFSLFRLYQTGRNSNNHYYLPCSGLELYGTLAQSPTASVPREGIELSYSYDFDANGVFYWIGTRGKRQPWRNPGQAGYVTCSASALATNPPSAPAWAIVGRELCRCVSAASPNMFFDVNLKDKRVRPTAYTIRHYNSWDTEALRNWVFEGSNDGAKWVLIKEHINDPALDKKGATFTWPVVSPGNQAFQIFRIRQTGLNSNNHHYLACSGFELYGHMYEANQPIEEVMSHELKESLPPFKDGTEFRHTFDFDEQGIVYWLGSLGRMREWRNPAQTGLLKVTASPLASQSAPAWAACGREVVRCVTEPKKHTFFCFDFGNLYIVPTAYTLRHYDSWDTEALRSWKLEGSIDGKKWKTLISHKKDAALNAKGASHTWPIKGVTKSYSMFKVTQTGKNSNKHWYLCLSGFEIYGQVYSFRKK